MNKLAKVIRYAFLSLQHLCSRQRLQRTPEPSAVTTDAEDVHDYDRVMSTVMALPYVLALNYVARARGHTSGARALDLCCGPGLFTLLLREKLGYADVLGIDLSQGMIEAARKNAAAARGDGGRVRFEHGSAFGLPTLAAQSFDLVTLCNGAHQFDTIEQVRLALTEADRLAKTDGLILVLDPVRQKTSGITEGYLRVAGQDYLDQGMPAFYRQFRESLYASWTPRELADALPAARQRRWFQVLPNGLPTFQLLVGVPTAQDRPFPNPAPAQLASVIPHHARFDWAMLTTTFAAGSIREAGSGRR